MGFSLIGEVLSKQWPIFCPSAACKNDTIADFWGENTDFAITTNRVTSIRKAFSIEPCLYFFLALGS